MAVMPDAALLEDPQLLETAWNLEDLVDGEGEAGVASPPRPGAGTRAGLRRALRRAGRRARRPTACARRWRSSVEIHDLVSRAGHYASLAFAVDTADPKNGALLQAVEEKPTRAADHAAVLRPRVGRAARRAGRGAAGRRRPRLRPPPPALRAPLPPAPALRARGEDPRREEPDRPQRLDAAVRGADVGDLASTCPIEDGRSSSRSRSSRLQSPDREQRRVAAESVTAGLAPRPALPGLRLQHAAGRQDGRRPAAPLPALAGGAQPGQRGDRRVGPGARRARCATATTSRSAGTRSRPAARRRQARRLRPHGRGDRGRGRGRLARRRASS